MAIIREYSPLDYPQVRKNLEEADIFYEGRDSQSNYDALTNTDEGLILVAEKEDEIVGSLLGQQLGISLAHIWSGVVAEKHRREGIAVELATTMEHQLRTIGVEEVWAFVDVKNFISQAMLEKLGFKTNKGHVYYGPWKEI